MENPLLPHPSEIVAAVLWLLLPLGVMATLLILVVRRRRTPNNR